MIFLPFSDFFWGKKVFISFFQTIKLLIESFILLFLRNDYLFIKIKYIIPDFN